MASHDHILIRPDRVAALTEEAGHTTRLFTLQNVQGRA